MTAYDVADRVLAVAVDALTDAGRTVPGRVAVMPGALPAWDCEQLTVNVTRPVVPGTPSRDAAAARPIPLPFYVELRVELVREVAVGDGDPVDPLVLDAAARGLLEDADALRLGMTPALLGGRPGRSVLLGALETSGPQGGMISVAMTVQVPG